MTTTTTTDRAALGKRLRAAREAAGLSQRQVAARLGYHHPTIVWIEQGTRTVSFLEAVQLAHIYGIEVMALLGTASQSQETPGDPGVPLLQPATG